MTRTPALLVLDDGACFEGYACGAKGEASGEVVFTTSMTGYQETLSDPSYYGQIVTFTTAHIGNYGVTPLDRQSDRLFANGAVFHDLFIPAAGPFPHWRAAESLDRSLAMAGMTVISGVDTRALTLHLRDQGARNGIISALDLDRASLARRARDLPSMYGRDLAGLITCAESYLYENGPYPDGETTPFRVAVYDFGVKRAILNSLRAAGIEPRVWPATTPAETVLASKPDGVLLSNGPGDPGACGYAIAAARTLLGRIPLFGICLGQQILGLALGASVYKLKFGHHGANHPVKDLDSGRVLVTSQNHNFCLTPDSLPQSARITHWNLNDDTLAGFARAALAPFLVE
jgi:carbamoyl-phosphate synthase small subunit